MAENTFSFTKKVPLWDILRSLYVLFSIAFKTDRKLVVLYYLTALLGGLITLGTSWALKLVIDQLQKGQEEALTTIPMTVVYTLMALYIISLVQDLLFHTYNMSYLDYILRYKMQNAVTCHFVRKTSGLDIAHFENATTQDLITQVQATMKWQVPDLLRQLSYVTTGLIGYTAAFIVLLPFGWWIPGLITLLTLPRLYFRSKYGSLQWSLWGAGAPQMRKLYYYDNLLSNKVPVREMRISRSAPALIQKFEQIQGFLLKLNQKALTQYLWVSIFPPILETFAIVLIAYSFLDDVLLGVFSIGTFTLLVTMLGQINSSAAQAAAHFGGIYENGLYLYNFVKLLEIEPLVPQPESPVHLDATQPPCIEFRNVSFAYPKGPMVLTNISLKVMPGESIALVGQNGAGKSTIISLLCRFYDVSEGKILINGINIKDIDLNSWYKLLGTLFQNYVPYHFTIRENIAFENPEEASLEKLIAAAQKSGAHDYITNLPNGYEQQLGNEFENGVELSGGQWQKLAIARAFYNQPPVLILDEPTSAIDAEAEYEIFTNLEKQYRDKSLILVSHRFSTVRNADTIYVIDQGEIIEQGTHEALLKQAGKYASLFQAQAEGYQ